MFGFNPEDFHEIAETMNEHLPRLRDAFYQAASRAPSMAKEFKNIGDTYGWIEDLQNGGGQQPDMMTMVTKMMSLQRNMNAITKAAQTDDDVRDELDNIAAAQTEMLQDVMDKHGDVLGKLMDVLGKGGIGGLGDIFNQKGGRPQQPSQDQNNKPQQPANKRPPAPKKPKPKFDPKKGGDFKL